MPFCLLAIANISLIVTFSQRKTTATSSSMNQKKKNTMNQTVIIITLLFIIMTGPGSIVAIFYNLLLQTETGVTIIYLGDSIEFSYHSYSLLILYFTNSKFSNELKRLFGLKMVQFSESLSASHFNPKQRVSSFASTHETAVVKRPAP